MSLALFTLLSLAAADDAKERVLVLDLEAVGVSSDIARAVDPLVLDAAGAVDGVEVVSQSEIKKLAEVDASRAEIGCETSSCLAEMAGALGARVVLFGSVSQLGKKTTLALSLYDNRTGAIARETISVDDVGALAVDIKPRVRALLDKALGRATVSARPPEPPAPPSTMFMAGVVCAIAGGAALLGGGAYAAINEATIQDPGASGATKQLSMENGLVGLIGAALGVVVAGAGAALIVIDVGSDA